MIKWLSKLGIDLIRNGIIFFFIVALAEFGHIGNAQAPTRTPFDSTHKTVANKLDTLIYLNKELLKFTHNKN